jgi:hypothetical protein
VQRGIEESCFTLGFFFWITLSILVVPFLEPGDAHAV